MKLPLAALAASLPLLSACGPRPNEFPPPCPYPTLFQGVSDLERYRPGANGADPADVVVRARMTGLGGSCQEGASKFFVDATVVVQIELARGPAAPGRKVQVPVFLAVIEGDAIINRQVFPVDFEFPPNVERATIATPPIAIALPVTKEKSAAAYTLAAGFQLTPEELARNRRGRR